LDVVSVSPVISDIIKSVTSPGFSLALVFYLFCVTVIIWARFGMTHFAEYMEVVLYFSVKKTSHLLL
jgi:low affinity Fe/Cu permease